MAIAKSIRNLRYNIFYGLLLRRGYELVTLGDTSIGLQWTICPTNLNERSIVYSAGVGSDISFERELVKRFGCNVILLDPSPTGVRTMSLPENKIPQFRFFPFALTRRAGKIKMAPPEEAGVDSWSTKDQSKGTIEIEATDLSSLMTKNGHRSIDLLKLDIEGCEYEVISDILDRGIPVRQLCADFDYGYAPGATRGQAIRAMLRLASRGYRLICQDGANHTFLRRDTSDG